MKNATHSQVDRLLTRPFGLLVTAHLLQGLGFSSMMLLPLYLEHLDASRTEIGAIMATAAVTGLVTRPLVGFTLDRFGRKPTIYVGTVFTVVSMAALYLVDRVGPLAYLVRGGFGIGVGTLFAAYFTFAADIIPAARRTEGLALFGVSGLLPLVLNPLSESLGIAAADIGWFLPLISLVIALSVVPVFFIEEPGGRGPAATQSPPNLREVAWGLSRPHLWSIGVATVVFASFVSIFANFATVSAKSQGVEGPANLWLAYALGAVSVRIFGARVPDRVGPQNMVAPALGLYAGAMLLLFHAQEATHFFAAAALAGIGHGYCFPVLTSQLVSRTDPRLRGTALSAFTALWQGSELVAGPSFGALADAYDDAAMYLVAAVLGIALLTVWFGLEHRLAPRKIDAASTP
ncbi:MAG: MFS transporter [Myxococcota bacterium]